MKLTILFLLISFPVLSKSSLLDSVNRLKWGDLPVVWIEDNKFPRFTMSVYFNDGALTDPFPGLTQATFDQLSSGTSKESEKELAEFFDFYAASIRSSVTHEYSVFTVQALMKDMEPVMGKVCELFKDGQFPEKELNSYKSRSMSQLKNIVTSHAKLADRVFRNLSLKNTPYAQPVEGTLAGFDKLSSAKLKERLAVLNNSNKAIYISGPKGIKKLESILRTSCPWKSGLSLGKNSIPKPAQETALYLIPVSGANQAQIRIGRYLNSSEVPGKHDQFQFLAGFLGGGFTSKLVQELRVKRGLTYSASSYVSMQKDYGRAGIMTFSKNETAAETIAIIQDVFQQINAGQITDEEFKHQQGHQVGGFAFGFEATSALLGQVMLYDHQKRNLEELVEFPKRIERMSKQELSKSNLEVFPWDKLTIVVVGDKSLEKSLSRIRPVRILNFEDFL